MRKIVKNISIAMLGGLLGASGGSAIGGELSTDQCLIHSKGGLRVEYAEDSSYWLAVAGMAAFDRTQYMGSYRDKALDPASGFNPIPGIQRPPHRAFPNSANIRNLVVGVGGGVGPNWSYVLGVRAVGRKILFDDTYLTYCGLCENFKLSFGNVPGEFFGFDSSNSLNWIPFLERNLASQAFEPCEGLGVLARYHWCDGSIIASALQPSPHESVFEAYVLERSVITESHTLPIPRDYWTATARFTFAPVHTDCDVYHFGISAMWQEQPTVINRVPVFGKRFRAYPGARGRATHDGLVNTTARLVDTGHLRANYIRQFNIEFARQWGPVILDGEYTDAYVHRIGDPDGALDFSGWNIQGRYMLTGEQRDYSVEYGNFCGICPHYEWGAVELAVRYDFINLNSKNLRGGTEHDATFGINWFVNENTRFTLNYIRANIHPGSAAAIAVNETPNIFHRHLDIVGLRANFRF